MRNIARLYGPQPVHRKDEKSQTDVPFLHSASKLKAMKLSSSKPPLNRAAQGKDHGFEKLAKAAEDKVAQLDVDERVRPIVNF